MSKLNSKHQELLERIQNDTMGSEEAVRQFFRGRFFEQDAALAISGALFDRYLFARRMQEKSAIENDLSQANAWSEIAGQWDQAFSNVYEKAVQAEAAHASASTPDEDFKGLEVNPKTVREVTEELHDYALGVLPPIYAEQCFAMGEIFSGDSYFWFAKIGNKFFGFLGNRSEAETTFKNMRGK